MCGIWALVNMIKNTKSLKDVDLAKHFADFLKLKNRGPDNTSFETFSNAWVGFHRLAIMDTSFDSNQPFIIKILTNHVYHQFSLIIIELFHAFLKHCLNYLGICK